MTKTSLLILISFLLFNCSGPEYTFELSDLNTPGNSSLRAICAVDEQIIWTSGSQGMIYRTRVLSSPDHGESWEFLDTPVMTGESAGLFSVNFSGVGYGVAVGGDYNTPERKGITAIFYNKGEKRWQKAETMPAAYRSSVVSLDKKFFFATGKTGCDYSTDGGLNWMFIDSTGYYAADAPEGKNMIFLAGSDGRVAKLIVNKK